MFVRWLSIVLVVFLLVMPVLAETKESFSQGVDITFWQTLPFAAFWGHVIDRQLFPGAAVHWDMIMLGAVAVSIGNAIIHTQKVMNERKGDSIPNHN